MCKSRAKCRMGTAHPTAHPQQLGRSELETCGRERQDVSMGWSATLFHSTLEQSCWKQNSQAARYY